MAKLPTAAMDTAIPNAAYPFRITLRGADVPATNDFKLIFKSGCARNEINVTATPLAADDTVDPPLEAGKEISGSVSKDITKDWYDTVTWALIYDTADGPIVIIGGVFKTEFKELLAT